MYNISDNSRTELQRNLFSSAVETDWFEEDRRKKMKYSSCLTSLSSGMVLLRVHSWLLAIFTRERERDNQSARQRHRERFINFIMCSKKVAIITALWESDKSRRCYVTVRTCAASPGHPNERKPLEPQQEIPTRLTSLSTFLSLCAVK